MARLGRRCPVQPVLKKLTPLAAPNLVPPVPPPIARSHAANTNAIRRQRAHVFLGKNVVIPVVVVPIPRVRPRIKVRHDEARIGARGRGHEQEVSTIINQLGRSGELTGSNAKPALGYLADDPEAVGTTEVLPISEVLDRIIAYIKSQNGTGI